MDSEIFGPTCSLFCSECFPLARSEHSEIFEFWIVYSDKLSLLLLLSCFKNLWNPQSWRLTKGVTKRLQYCQYCIGRKSRNRVQNQNNRSNSDKTDKRKSFFSVFEYIRHNNWWQSVTGNHVIIRCCHTLLEELSWSILISISDACSGRIADGFGAN